MVLPEWTKPHARGVIALAYLSGIALVLGHHFFYSSLSGRPPPAAVYRVLGTSTALTGQQVNLAVGAALAFLAKTALSVVVAVSAEQSAWRTIKTGSMTLGGIDSLLSMRSNILCLLNFESWKKDTLGVLLAVLYWLLPITALITPATLTVENVVQKTSHMQRVPQIDFTSLNFAEILVQQALNPTYYYSSPQYSVLRVVTGALSQSSILPIQSPHKNASWSLTFPGPAVECGNIEAQLENSIKQNIKAAINSTRCGVSYGYISWVPTATVGPHGADSINHLPFHRDGEQYRPSNETLGPRLLSSPQDDADANNSLRLYIAVVPGMATLPSADCGSAVADAKLITCQLYNTSYTTEFTYVDGIQHIELSTAGSYGYTGYSLGTWGVDQLSYPTDPAYSWEVDAPTAYNVPLVRGFAYQAVLEAFNKVLTGSISTLTIEGSARLSISSDVVNSPLLNSKELSFLNQWDYSGSLQSAANHGNAKWNGLSVSPPDNPTLPMKEVIEGMFRNATISLMNSAMLQPNYSSPYAPDDVMVQTTPYLLLYTYSAVTLWLAYGVALGISLLSIAICVILVGRNSGYSFTTKFSTILRIVQAAHLSTDLQPADANGNDPTPKHIEKIVISFPDNGEIVYEPTPAYSGLKQVPAPT